MKVYFFRNRHFGCLCCLLAVYSAKAQYSQEVANWPDMLVESSGLILANDRLFTHTDSGGEACIYEVDATTAKVIREVQIENAKNVDWEDICRDSLFFYIADIGNNRGSRRDLTIYKIRVSEILDSSVSKVSADAIHFSYGAQSDFETKIFRTNFDAEAIISLGDSLYVFTKNWGNRHTDVYSVPKAAGTYVSRQVATFDTKGLVTCADTDDRSGKIILAGYTILLAPFLVKIGLDSGASPSWENRQRYTFKVPRYHSTQVEGLTVLPNSNVYLSAEKSCLGKGGIYKLVE